MWLLDATPLTSWEVSLDRTAILALYSLLFLSWGIGINAALEQLKYICGLQNLQLRRLAEERNLQ